MVNIGLVIVKILNTLNQKSKCELYLEMRPNYFIRRCGNLSDFMLTDNLAAVLQSKSHRTLWEAARADAISSAGGRCWGLCQTVTEACSSVSRDPTVRTHRWAGQVLTCPPAAPNYHLILLWVILFRQNNKKKSSKRKKTWVIKRMLR